MQPKTLTKTLLYRNIFNSLSHRNDRLCHLATLILILVQQRWPSDKANHTCEIYAQIIVCHLRSQKCFDEVILGHS